MQMDNNLINEIRNSVDIVDVISSYIPLISRGKNYFGVCPFHDDHSPSMSVSKEKQIYTCFSCGATGNVFNFIQDYEKISFKDALKKCADIAGIDVNIKGDTKKLKNQELYDIYDMAQKFYQNNLNTEYGKKAISYLQSRGLDIDTIKHFNIGLSLNTNDTLFNILRKRNYAANLLIKSGLITENNKDVFVNRIMFPLYDSNGRLIGYNGRIYNNEDTNRYVNTKETEIFKKREFLYNYHSVLEDVRRQKQVIIMEGPMDVINSYQHGIKNVIATMGTAFSPEHALLIRRLKCEVILCFDGDDAGRKGTKLAIDELTKIGIIPKVVMLDNGLDPDSALKQDEKMLKDLIANPLTIMEYKEKMLHNNLNLNNTEELAIYVNDMLKEISKIDDEILKEITINKLVLESKLDKELLLEKLANLNKKNEKVVDIPKVEKKKIDKYEKSERNLLYYMLHYGDVITMYDKKVTHISNDSYRKLAYQVSAFYKKNKYINVADLITELKDDKDAIKTIGELESLNLHEKYTEEEIDDYLNNILEENINNQISIYKKELQAENSLDKKIEYANKLVEFKLRSEENDR
ncbi:MAG: DNA primase [Bacilli bacterium]|nr:DNA primase [Bacilli bacterium]